jgi:hypothetical protein
MGEIRFKNPQRISLQQTWNFVKIGAVAATTGAVAATIYRWA